MNRKKKKKEREDYASVFILDQVLKYHKSRYIANKAKQEIFILHLIMYIKFST